GREARPLVPERLTERVASRLFVVDGWPPVREPERSAEDSRIWQVPSDQRRVVTERPSAREHGRLSAPLRFLAVLECELEIPRIHRRNRDDRTPDDERGDRYLGGASRRPRSISVERLAPQPIELRKPETRRSCLERD